MIRTLLFLFVLSTTACVSVQSPVILQFDDPARLRFQGKGAGAGVMLMSAMGPAGIAVGIAIDEGIGKDIEKAATDKSLDIQQALRAAANQYAPSTLTAITVHRYGYIAQGGRDEHTVAELHLTLHYRDGKAVELHYPGEREQNALPHYALDALKTDGELVVQGLRKAMKSVLE